MECGRDRSLHDFDAYQPPRRNYVYVLFNDPTVRRLHSDWVGAASSAVAALRMEAAQDPDDPALATLVGELSVQHEDFRTWWAAHKVTAATSGRKQYQHPLVGDLTLDCDMWDSPDGGGQRLMVLTAEPGSAYCPLAVTRPATGWFRGRRAPCDDSAAHRGVVAAGGVAGSAAHRGVVPAGGVETSERRRVRARERVLVAAGDPAVGGELLGL
jgi:hypothetical protein